MILPKNNNNQGVFLELLVADKSATIRYPAGYQYDIRPDNWATNRIPDSRIPDSEKWAG